MDGKAGGRIKCTLANWTGIAYKIPRTMLDKAKDISYLNQTGVYLLFGTSDDKGEPLVYIGQARKRKNGRGILCRLEEHHRIFKDFYWTDAVAITTSNNSYGPTEISHLESRFREIADEAKRYIVSNSNKPNPGNTTEEKKSELEEFIVYARLVMGALGYKVFEPLITHENEKSKDEVSDNEPFLYFKTAKAEATGKRTSEGFVVLAGSSISSEYTKSCPENVVRLREKHAEKIDDKGILKADILFSSPSSAAGFVGGGSFNGNIMWKDATGRALKEIDAAE